MVRVPPTKSPINVFTQPRLNPATPPATPESPLRSFHYRTVNGRCAVAVIRSAALTHVSVANSRSQLSKETKPNQSAAPDPVRADGTSSVVCCKHHLFADVGNPQKRLEKHVETSRIVCVFVRGAPFQPKGEIP